MKEFYQQIVIDLLAEKIYEVSGSKERLEREVFELKQEVEKLKADKSRLERSVAEYDKEIENALNFCNGEAD